MTTKWYRDGKEVSELWGTEKLNPQIYRNSWDHRFRTHDPRAVITHLTSEEYRALYLEVFKITAPAGPRRILDYGCGTGLVIPVVEELWPEAKYDGADISGDMIIHNQVIWPSWNGSKLTKYRWHIVPEAFHEEGVASLSKNSFDFIICHSVLTHLTLEDGKELLKTLHGLLEDGGKASISIYASNQSEDISGDWGKVVYRGDYFEDMLKDAGFECDCIFIDGPSRTGQSFCAVRKGEK